MLPEPSPLMLLWQWAPALLQGFGLNILMGVTAMLVATLVEDFFTAGAGIADDPASFALPQMRRSSLHVPRMDRDTVSSVSALMMTSL